MAVPKMACDRARRDRLTAEPPLQLGVLAAVWAEDGCRDAPFPV